MSLSDICQLDGNSPVSEKQSGEQFQIPVFVSNIISDPVKQEVRRPVRRVIRRNNIILQSMAPLWVEIKNRTMNKLDTKLC